MKAYRSKIKKILKKRAFRVMGSKEEKAGEEKEKIREIIKKITRFRSRQMESEGPGREAGKEKDT